MPARMPPRKEQKETVVYPASKRKAPPFKPLSRPSKVPRIPTTESESSTKASTGAVRRFGFGKDDNDVDDDDEEGDTGRSARVGAQASGSAAAAAADSDEELEDDPLTARPSQPKTKPPIAAKAKTSAREAGPANRSGAPALSISSQSDPTSSPPPTTESPAIDADADAPPRPTQLSDPTQLPSPLLTRLLHESFSSPSTRIDKHAHQVLQKYVEIFVREGIARTALAKREKVERGEGEEGDAKWLELEDLEGVAAGMMLDF